MKADYGIFILRLLSHETTGVDDIAQCHSVYTVSIITALPVMAVRLPRTAGNSGVRFRVRRQQRVELSSVSEV